MGIPALAMAKGMVLIDLPRTVVAIHLILPDIAMVELLRNVGQHGGEIEMTGHPQDRITLMVADLIDHPTTTDRDLMILTVINFLQVVDQLPTLTLISPATGLTVDVEMIAPGMTEDVGMIGTTGGMTETEIETGKEIGGID